MLKDVGRWDVRRHNKLRKTCFLGVTYEINYLHSTLAVCFHGAASMSLNGYIVGQYIMQIVVPVRLMYVV